MFVNVRPLQSLAAWAMTTVLTVVSSLALPMIFVGGVSVCPILYLFILVVCYGRKHTDPSPCGPRGAATWTLGTCSRS